jgi:tetratricopeptide (TPR) repeat protein
MRKPILATMLGTLLLAPAVAAGQVTGLWIPPKCDIKPGHFLVNSAVLYLINAAKTRFDDVRERDLRDANRSLTQALTTGGQDKNPAAWYYLGRYYVIRNDAVGADSAFRKAETLMPACKEDILFYRRNALWVPVFNAGVAALTAQNHDSAIAAFRRANLIYDAEPQGFAMLATVFFNIPAEAFLPDSVFRLMYPNLPDSAARMTYDSITRTRYDSAAKYFRRGFEAASDPRFAGEKKDAIFNLGNSFFAAQNYDSAAAAFSEYLRVVPNDPVAMARLGDVLSAGGHTDSAMAVYRQIIAHADSVESQSLFNAGVSIYNAAPPFPDTAALGSGCRTERRAGRPTVTATQRRAIAVACDSVMRQTVRDRDAAAAGNYRIAAQAFEAGLTKNPQSRDGLYNLANAFLALREPDKMLPIAQRLILVDPMNRNAVRLVAQAWQLKNKGDSALHYVILADSLLPVDVTVSRFSPGDQNASITGLITNYHNKPSTPFKLVCEFLNTGGEPVATQSVDIPTIDAGGNHPFTLQAIGAGIEAWRYRKK